MPLIVDNHPSEFYLLCEDCGVSTIQPCCATRLCQSNLYHWVIYAGRLHCIQPLLPTAQYTLWDTCGKDYSSLTHWLPKGLLALSGQAASGSTTTYLLITVSFSFKMRKLCFSPFPHQLYFSTKELVTAYLRMRLTLSSRLAPPSTQNLATWKSNKKYYTQHIGFHSQNLLSPQVPTFAHHKPVHFNKAILKSHIICQNRSWSNNFATIWQAHHK